MLDSLVLRDGPLEVGGKAVLVCIISNRMVNLLVVDVHFNIGKNECKIIYMDNENNSSNCSPLILLSRFLNSSSASASSFCSFFSFFGLVSIVTTTPDKFQVQNRNCLSQTKAVAPMLLILKIYAFFFELGSRKNFLFAGHQDIVNYSDFPSTIS